MLTRVHLHRVLVLGHDVVPVDRLLAEPPLVAGVGRARTDEDSRPDVAQRDGDPSLVWVEGDLFDVWKVNFSISYQIILSISISNLRFLLTTL